MNNLIKAAVVVVASGVFAGQTGNTAWAQGDDYRPVSVSVTLQKTQIVQGEPLVALCHVTLSGGQRVSINLNSKPVDWLQISLTDETGKVITPNQNRINQRWGGRYVSDAVEPLDLGKGKRFYRALPDAWFGGLPEGNYIVEVKAALPYASDSRTVEDLNGAGTSIAQSKFTFPLSVKKADRFSLRAQAAELRKAVLTTSANDDTKPLIEALFALPADVVQDEWDLLVNDPSLVRGNERAVLVYQQLARANTPELAAYVAKVASLAQKRSKPSDFGVTPGQSSDWRFDTLFAMGEVYSSTEDKAIRQAIEDVLTKYEGAVTAERRKELSIPCTPID